MDLIKRTIRYVIKDTSLIVDTLLLGNLSGAERLMSSAIYDSRKIPKDYSYDYNSIIQIMQGVLTHCSFRKPNRMFLNHVVGCLEYHVERLREQHIGKQ